MEARLAYMNHGDKKWTEHSKLFVHRNLDCEIDPDKKRPGYYYDCSLLHLFELGSLHHDYYLCASGLAEKSQEWSKEDYEFECIY